MSPKTADPAVRTALLEGAARLIATEGSAGLTLRRLADDVGTSTMAVYTHFGGMQNLRQEVRREGFARLRAHLEAVHPTGDPVADLGRLGWAYHDNALENPNLYRAMFMDHPEPAGPTASGSTRSNSSWPGSTAASLRGGSRRPTLTVWPSSCGAWRTGSWPCSSPACSTPCWR